MKNTFPVGEVAVLSELKDLWHRILNADAINEEDDFFKIGGNSMLAIQMLVKTTEKFHVDLDLDKFFASPTLRALSDQINKANSGA
jgi:acyl carrier protein